MGSWMSSESVSDDQGSARMNFFDLANLLDNDGNLQNEMMVFSFAATLLATIPVLLGNEFDVNVGLRRKKRDLADPRSQMTLPDVPKSIAEGVSLPSDPVIRRLSNKDGRQQTVHQRQQRDAAKKRNKFFYHAKLDN